MRGETITQELSIQDILNYQTVTNTSVSGAFYIDMLKFTRGMYVIQFPSLGAAGTLDGRLQSCSLTNFASGVHNIPNTNLTQILTGSTVGNNGIATIEVSAQSVQYNNPGDRYVRIQLTGGGNALTVVGSGWGGQSNQLPASQWDLSSSYVSQRVQVQ